MNPAVIDGPALNHLGAVVHKIRPQWDAPGIRAALEKSLARHGYSDVAIVAVSSARDPKAATPGVIPTRCADGWMGEPTGEAKTATQDATTRITDMACRQCGLWVVRGEDHECARRADPDRTRDALAAAKAAIAKPEPDDDLPEETH